MTMGFKKPLRNRVMAGAIAVALLAVFVAGCSTDNQKSQIKSNANKVTLTVSAAASLTDALGEIEKMYTDEHANVKLVMNYGSSGSLQQQIEQGAPADLFISAANKQMDELQKKSLLTDGTRKIMLKNHLVLIAPKDSTKVKDINSLTGSEIKVVASGEPSSVPAGKYTQESLTNLGIWKNVKPKLVQGKDVRQVLTYVESGNADTGFVYLTDAKTSNKVRIVSIVDEKYHSPIVYPIAVVRGSKNQDEAKAFETFLFSGKAKAVFEKYGFVIQP